MGPLAERDLKWNTFFFEAKENKQLVSVVDRWSRTHEGRIYRNGTDRVNVVSLDGRKRIELYYTDITTAKIVGSEPERLKPFFGDWNKRSMYWKPK